MTASAIVQNFSDSITIDPGTTVVAKTAIKLGTGLFGIPMEAGVSGDQVAFAIRGPWGLPKTAGGGITFAVGDRVYWNSGTSLATATTTDDEIGICIATAANGDSFVSTDLNGRVDSTSDALLKSTFNAHTIVYATVDNTPVALTVGASTIVGRKASGNIVALTGAEVAAILPAASTSVVGVSAMATTAEVDTGTNTTKAITPDALNGSAPTISVANVSDTLAGIDSDATAHASSSGASHTYLDQSVVSGATPTFTGTNFSGIPTGAVAQATTAALGAVALATTAEVNTGTDANKAITPDALNGSAPTISVANVSDTLAGIDSDATAHASATGASHSYIDQDVTSGSTPTFTGTNFTGIPAAGVTGTALTGTALIYQLVTVLNGDTTCAVAATGGQVAGKPVHATIKSKGANSVAIAEAEISAGNINITLTGDPGAGDCDIATWTDNR